MNCVALIVEILSDVFMRVEEVIVPIFRYVMKMPYLCEDLSDFTYTLYIICVSSGGFWL